MLSVNVNVDSLKQTRKALDDMQMTLYVELGTLNKRAAQDLVDWLKNALYSQAYFSGRSLNPKYLQKKVSRGQSTMIGFATEVMYNSLRVVSSSGGTRGTAGFVVGWPTNLYNEFYYKRSNKGNRSSKKISVNEYASYFDSKYPWFDEAVQEWNENKFPDLLEVLADKLTDRFRKEWY